MQFIRFLIILSTAYALPVVVPERKLPSLSTQIDAESFEPETVQLFDRQKRQTTPKKPATSRYAPYPTIQAGKTSPRQDSTSSAYQKLSESLTGHKRLRKTEVKTATNVMKLPAPGGQPYSQLWAAHPLHPNDSPSWLDLPPAIPGAVYPNYG